MSFTRERRPSRNPREKAGRRRRVGASSLLCVALFVPELAAQRPDPKSPQERLPAQATSAERARGRSFQAQIVGVAKDALPIEAPGGWPLTVLLTARESPRPAIGFGRLVLPGARVAVDPGIEALRQTCTQEPRVWVPATKAGAGGLRKRSNPRPDRRPAAPGSAVDRAPNIDPPSCGNAVKRSIGPCGESYGVNRRLPGLVVVADHGPSVIFDDHLEPSSPLRARNLAGFFQSVALELKDGRGRTSIEAHLNVPPGLLSPHVRKGPRLRGLPRHPVHRSLFVVTVRAFLVAVDEANRAPAELADVDGNGVVDRNDAVRAGFTVLSSEAVARYALAGTIYDYQACTSEPGTEYGASDITPVPR